MIYEVRTYRLQPGTLGTFVERYREAYEDRKAFSPLAASLTCEIGPLDQFVNVWPYESHAHREQVRRDSMGAAGRWPPHSPDLLRDMHSQIFEPFDFAPEFLTGRHGPVFEWRTYQLRTDSVPAIREVWSEAVDARRALSPLVAAMASENGTLNVFVHVWGYESLAHRDAVRAEAVAKGVWPPRNAPPGTIVQEDSKILVPTSFSPLM